MVLEAPSDVSGFVSCLIDNAAAGMKPCTSFRSLEEAQTLALGRLKDKVMLCILEEMETSRSSGCVTIKVWEDTDVEDWLDTMGFNVFRSGDGMHICWGRFPQPSSWQRMCASR